MRHLAAPPEGQYVNGARQVYADEIFRESGGNECMRTSFISVSETNAPEADQQEQGRRVRQERDHTRTLPDPHFARPSGNALGTTVQGGAVAPNADIARLVATLEQTRPDLSRTGGKPNLLAMPSI
jgi:hypothetical protein